MVAERYRQEKLPRLKGQSQDEYRLAFLIERFGRYSLEAIDSTLVSVFRNERLKTVKPQTVKHELNLISRIYSACILDWGVSLPRGNPVKSVRQPQIDNARDRRLSQIEERYLVSALQNPETKSPNPWIHPILVFAIETAARQSEILSLEWAYVHLDNHVRLRGVDGRNTKNADEFREVPLSETACSMLHKLTEPAHRTGRVFPISQEALKQSWSCAVSRARKNYVFDVLRKRLLELNLEPESEIRALVFKKRAPSALTVKALQEVERYDTTLLDLHFHDLRHEGTSRLAEVFELHELMKITGHKTSRMLMRYYHPKIGSLAAKLRSAKVRIS